MHVKTPSATAPAACDIRDTRGCDASGRDGVGREAAGRQTGARDAAARLRGLLCLSGLALLTACASHTPPMTAVQEAATFREKAKPAYAPPGPPDDPWRPFIEEAANRFDVPERWIREVMRVESNGEQWTPSGVLTTSPVGAMGLMQLMPETYDEMRARYNLGDDAFDPHSNILAGTAYLREMYDAFGSPGFLAAYNGGPARLEDYLTKNRPLPTETRRYVAMIAPYIQGSWPVSRSPAEEYAVNRLPIDIPAGPRYPRHVTMVAVRTRRGHAVAVRYASLDHRHRGHASAPVEVAEAPEARPGPARPSVRLAFAAPAHHGGLHLIEPAMAGETAGRHFAGNDWSIQVGAYGNAGLAHQAAGAARGAAGHAQMVVASVKSGHATLYRARLSGLTHDAAVHACQKLGHSHSGCMVVAPSA
jgi:soluble lytic murein transglycosylase-like protein